MTRQFVYKHAICLFTVRLYLGGKGIHPRRLLGEPLDQTVIPTASCFCVTADNRYIIACGYWDKSFKVFSTDTGQYCLVYRGCYSVA